MTDLTIRQLDAHEVTALTTAVAEYRSHTSARGELIASMVTDALKAKLQQAIEETLYQERISEEETN